MDLTTSGPSDSSLVTVTASNESIQLESGGQAQIINPAAAHIELIHETLPWNKFRLTILSKCINIHITGCPL